MKKPFASGDLVVLVAAANPLCRKFLGQIHKLGPESVVYLDSWRFDPPLFLNGDPVSWREADMRPIRDQPGNEQFVTELRNKLPRSKPATTKHDTINERGELA